MTFFVPLVFLFQNQKEVMCHSCIALMVYGTKVIRGCTIAWDDLELFSKKILIQESEQPKRDAVTVSDFGIINGKVAIREIGDLVKGLAPSSNFEQVFTVNQKVSALGIGHIMIHLQLAEKEGFPFIAFINNRAEYVH